MGGNTSPLIGWEFSGNMKMKEQRRGERRSDQSRRWDRHRRVTERRVSTYFVGDDNRSGVDRRVGQRRTDCDQRWGIERRAFIWVREGRDRMSLQYDRWPQQPM